MAISFYDPAPPPIPPPEGAYKPGEPGSAPIPPVAGNPSPGPEHDLLGGNRHTQTGHSPVSDYAGRPGGAGASIPLGDLVGGKFAVDLMDAVVPTLFVLMFRQMKIETKRTDMQLTEKEKNTLAPVVEACMRTIRIDFNNPWHTLGIGMCILYGTKAMEHGFGKAIDRKMAPPPRSTEELKADAIRKEEERKQADALANKSQAEIKTAMQNQGIKPWTETDVQKVKDKKRMSNVRSIEWLEKNWIRLGGVLPF